MKITIDLNNESFGDYFNESDGTLNFTAAAIDMILHAFSEKCRWDDEIRKYIKNEIKDGLWNKIYEYKNGDMVKAVATEVVKEAMKPINTGSFIVTDHEKKEITEQVKKELKLFNKPVDERIRETVRKEVANIIMAMYDGNKMREFIDVAKLSAYVTANMFREDTDNANQTQS